MTLVLDDDRPSRRLSHGVRRVRLFALTLGAAALVAGVGSGVVAGRLAQAREQMLTGVLGERSDIVAHFLDRADTVTRVTAQNTVFRDVYADRPGVGAITPKLLDVHEQARVDAALRYIETMFPDQVAEACFIDADGAELSRVVDGLVPGMERLSPDESGAAFFRPTLALTGDGTLQARPYVSPDTATWVVSSSTPVRLGDDATGRPVAVVHFEIRLESLRRQLADRLPDGVTVRVVDAGTGAVVVDSAAAVAGPDALAPAAGRYDVSGWSRHGIATTGGLSEAVHRLDRKPGDANDWFVVVTADGGSRWLRGAVPLAPLLVALLGALLLALSAAGFVEHSRRLVRRAQRDSLTGLANRDGLLAGLDQVLRARDGMQAVLLVDLDRFKQVNDTLGHGAGDRLLVEVARRFGVGHGSRDVVARLGGDEFAVLLGDLAMPQDAVVRARELVHRLDAPFDLDGVQVRVGASIGVALVGEHGDDAATLIRRADVAMYEAKRRRTGTVLFCSALETGPAQTLAFETTLLLAMERGELLLHYQPQIDLRTGEVRAVEALVRWQHPELGLLGPDRFVPTAEETGLIVGMTKYVLTLALDQVRAWRAAGVDVVVAVNIGARNLADPQLPTDVLQLLTERALPPSVLRLELTETDLLGDPDQARGVLQALRDSGIGIAVDDFGTGFASLAQLRNLPFDELKIDKSFVGVLDSDPHARHIVTSVVTLAHGLGLLVTAEGVETEACLDALDEVGCDTAQGYLLSRPLPADDAFSWLLRHDPRTARRDDRSGPGDRGRVARVVSPRRAPRSGV